MADYKCGTKLKDITFWSTSVWDIKKWNVVSLMNGWGNSLYKRDLQNI